MILKGVNRQTRTCLTSMTHPYCREGFWDKPENQYWESDNYTEEGKEYLRGFLKKRNERSRRIK